MNALSTVEMSHLEECERGIQQGLDNIEKNWREIARRLAIIQEGRLYRESYQSFESYCRERWGKGRSWAGHQIRALATAENLELRLGTPVPLSESQCRALVPFPPEVQQLAYQEAEDEGAVAATILREKARAAFGYLSAENQVEVVEEAEAEAIELDREDDGLETGRIACLKRGRHYLLCAKKVFGREAPETNDLVGRIEGLVVDVDQLQGLVPLAA